MKKDVSLVYMVAWMSSRFGGKIKQFAKVWPHDSSLIEYSLYQALPAWFSKIIFIVGKMTELPFKEMFWDSYQWIPVEYAMQSFDEAVRDRPRGTVDALCSAKNLVSWSCVVCNWDDIYGTRAFTILIQHLQDSEMPALVWYPLKNVLPDHWTTNRGILRLDEQGYVERVEETLWIAKDSLEKFWLIAEKDICNMNIFAMDAHTISKLDSYMTTFKQEHSWDRKIECYLPVELPKISKVKMYTTNDPWFWVTNPEDEEIVRNQIQEYENNKH
jgi:hypothetical protein